MLVREISTTLLFLISEIIDSIFKSKILMSSFVEIFPVVKRLIYEALNEKNIDQRNLSL